MLLLLFGGVTSTSLAGIPWLPGSWDENAQQNDVVKHLATPSKWKALDTKVAAWTETSPEKDGGTRELQEKYWKYLQRPVLVSQHLLYKYRALKHKPTFLHTTHQKWFQGHFTHRKEKTKSWQLSWNSCVFSLGHEKKQLLGTWKDALKPPNLQRRKKSKIYPGVFR